MTYPASAPERVGGGANDGFYENEGTIIINGVHFSAESKDTLEDKMKRLMRDDVKADNF